MRWCYLKLKRVAILAGRMVVKVRLPRRQSPAVDRHQLWRHLALPNEPRPGEARSRIPRRQESECPFQNVGLFHPKSFAVIKITQSISIRKIVEPSSSNYEFTVGKKQ
jgi:hypothetical protein